MRRILTALLLALALSGADAGVRGSEEVGAALEEFNAWAKFPLPTLDGGELQRLADGKVVRVRVVPDDPDQPQTVGGLLRVDIPRDAVWVALRDPHLQEPDDVVEALLSESNDAPSRWYQYIELPWPFTARQWVIDVVDNHALASNTGNRCWEHWWDLTPQQERIGAQTIAAGLAPEITPDELAEAIWLPVNKGAWVLIALPSGGTLVIYHVTTVVGGSIPDKTVADFSLLRMKKLLRDVERVAGTVEDHFVPGHAPVLGGDGRAIVPSAAPAIGVGTD